MTKQIIDTNVFKALVFDLDGVITQTADLHGQAWKVMFDEYLVKRNMRGDDQQPFSIERDYTAHVDGRPRYQGVQAFLESRGIELEYGLPEDPPSKETVCGLGNRKNEMFNQLLDTRGATVFKDSEKFIQTARQAGLVMAVATSSANGRKVLASAGLENAFDTVVDGNDLRNEQIPGKPEPDMFVEAAARVGAKPENAAVFEDAISGIQAGRAGGFRLVVGVDRVGGEHPENLAKSGADIVLSDLSLLTIA
jgi:beta-phosphoglucomutase family hydrolase